MTNITSPACDVPAEQWLDYVDGDIDESLKEDLTLHVAHCPVCQGHLKEFQAIGSVLEREDKLPDDEFFQHLEGKIMAKVGGLQMPTAARVFRWRNVSTGTWAMAAIFTFLITLPAVFSVIRNSQMNFLNRTVEVVDSSDRWMVETSEKDIAMFGDVINSHESADDLVLDSAAHLMAGLDESQTRRALGF